MSSLPFMPLYGRDFRSDTEHLRAREAGAYLLLMMTAWEMPGCRLPDDNKQLSRWARVDARAWTKIKPLVMAFWVLEDGFWTQSRLKTEFAKAHNRVEALRANARLGGRKKTSKTGNSEKPIGYPDGSNLVPISETNRGLHSHRTLNNNNNPASNTKSARGLAGDLGIADAMLLDIQAWVPSMDRPGAESWLSTQRQTFGASTVSASYAKLKTDMATGGLVSKPLQAWSKIAGRMQRESEVGPQPSARERAIEGTKRAREVARKMFEAQPGTMHRE